MELVVSEPRPRVGAAAAVLVREEARVAAAAAAARTGAVVPRSGHTSGGAALELEAREETAGRRGRCG